MGTFAKNGLRCFPESCTGRGGERGQRRWLVGREALGECGSSQGSTRAHSGRVSSSALGLHSSLLALSMFGEFTDVSS